jgi:hypothetical protein
MRGEPARLAATPIARIATASDRGFARPCVDAARADADADGLADDCEDALADRFAPVVFHSTDETNWPTDVDDFLAETSLAFHDESCAGAAVVARAPTQADLARAAYRSPCGGASARAAGTRSAGKRRTFFLADVDGARRAGSDDTRRWTTYAHVYPNDHAGLTIQYWRFYAYNDAFNDHGGDWEGLHVVLDRSLRVVGVDLLGHSSIARVDPRELAWEGDHPRVFSEGGGHATRASGDAIGARGCATRDPCVVALDEPGSFVRQETWRGGRVTWPGGVATPGGRIVNVGEKSAPRSGQLFIDYSGLWGSPGALFGTSGYWGPAFNETSMGDDGFVTAWCAGMAGALDRAKECWADDREP